MEIEVAMTYNEYFEGNRLFCLNTTTYRRVCFWLIWYGYPILAIAFALLTVLIWIGERRFSSFLVIEFAVSVFFSGADLLIREEFANCTNCRPKIWPERLF